VKVAITITVIAVATDPIQFHCHHDCNPGSATDAATYPARVSATVIRLSQKRVDEM